jgi:hypothetical protein
MTSSNIVCRAKNPATCAYHGQPVATSNSLRERIKALTSGSPVFFSSFSEKAKEVKGSVVITPLSPAAKTEPIYIDLAGSSYDEVENQLDATLQGIRLKEYKTGYKANIVLPSSENKDSVTSSMYASTQRNRLDDESITADGVDGFKQAIMVEARNQARNSELFSKVIEEIKDTKMAQSVSGAKAIAVVEAMHEFKYFNSMSYYKDPSIAHGYVTNAFNSILNGAGEYTNRGHGIRVWMNYKNNGEMSDAMFVLDEPNSKFNSFSDKQVKAVNRKLEQYFQSFNE